MILGLVGLFLLLVLINRWFALGGLLPGATPTLTKTVRATPTTTPDFRATQNIDDLSTQKARKYALLGLDTPTPLPTETPTPTPTSTHAVDIPRPTPTGGTTVVIPLPVINVSGATASPTSTMAIETPTPTPDTVTLTAVANANATATALVATLIATLAVTPTPTATPTGMPATPTPTPSSSPGVTPVVTLQAVTTRQTTVYMGPSTLYTQTTTFGSQQPLVLRGRDGTGEWVYFCCEANLEGWVRQAFLELRDNELPPGAPSNSNPNDVRWLAERPTTVVALEPLPSPTPIPDQDFPYYRRDPAAQARVDQPFRPGYGFAWDDPAQASRSMTSPALVVGPSVMVASEDLHLYSFEKETGNQRWRYQIGQVVRFAPAVQDANIYLVDAGGRVFALQDQGNQAVVLWQSTIGVSPASAVNLRGSLLLVARDDQRIIALKRADGSIRWSVPTSGNSIRYPTIGGQLVYVGNDHLAALDLYSGAEVWVDSAIGGVAAAPVYSFPGILALAELYVADEQGGIHSYDANTGRLLWQSAASQRTTGLAVDDTTVYASGTGFVKALDRRNGQELWSYTFSGEILAGPIVGNGRLLIVFQSGPVQILDAAQGTPLFTISIPTQTIGGAAVGGAWIFVPGADARLYALKEGD